MAFEHDYPQVPTTTVSSVPTKPMWVLNFTNNGIAMNRSRMREIETTIHRFGHGEAVLHLGVVWPTEFASLS